MAYLAPKRLDSLMGMLEDANGLLETLFTLSALNDEVSSELAAYQLDEFLVVKDEMASNLAGQCDDT